MDKIQSVIKTAQTAELTRADEGALDLLADKDMQVIRIRSHSLRFEGLIVLFLLYNAEWRIRLLALIFFYHTLQYH